MGLSGRRRTALRVLYWRRGVRPTAVRLLEGHEEVGSGILRQWRKVDVGTAAQTVLNAGPVQGATSLRSHPCVPNHELAGVFEGEPDVGVDLPMVANRFQQRCLDEV